jgi:hypothetical protein
MFHVEHFVLAILGIYILGARSDFCHNCFGNRMARRQANLPSITLTPEELAAIVLGAFGFFGEVLLPVITFWWRLGFVTLFTILLWDLCLRSQRIEFKPIARFFLSLAAMAIIGTVLWNPMRRQYMQEHLGPSFPFIIGASFNNVNSRNWAMLVNHYGPSVAHDCDVRFYDLASGQLAALRASAGSIPIPPKRLFPLDCN